jgi:hypothetical protein
MKKLILILLLCLCTLVQAQQTEVNYPQEYRWHGWQLYGDNTIHPTVSTTVRNIEIGATTHVDDELNDDFDTAVRAEIPLIDGLCLMGGYSYYILPNMDAQEASLTLALPGNIAPRYTISHVVPDNSENGQMHIFGVDVFLGDDPNEISATISADVTYNDGVNPFGDTVIRDFTHFSAGLVVNVPMQGFILQPSICYQHTFEEEIEIDKNECWCGIGIQYAF